MATSEIIPTHFGPFHCCACEEIHGLRHQLGGLRCGWRVRDPSAIRVRFRVPSRFLPRSWALPAYTSDPSQSCRQNGSASPGLGPELGLFSAAGQYRGFWSPQNKHLQFRLPTPGWQLGALASVRFRRQPISISLHLMPALRMVWRCAQSAGSGTWADWRHGLGYEDAHGRWWDCAVEGAPPQAPH